MRELYSGRFPVARGLGRERRGLEDAGEEIFTLLGVVRAFTKEPGKEPSLEEPILLPAGSTVLDLAARSTQDMAQKLPVSPAGSGVGEVRRPRRSMRDHPVRDGDIVEITSDAGGERPAPGRSGDLPRASARPGIREVSGPSASRMIARGARGRSSSPSA